MTLRVRLALTVLITAIPLVGGIVWLRKEVEKRTIEDMMRAFALDFVESEGYRLHDPRFADSWGGDLHRWHQRMRTRQVRPGPPDGGPPRPRGDARKGPGADGGVRRRPGVRPGTLPEDVHRWIFAFDSNFESTHRAAPKLPPHLIAAIRDGDSLAGGKCRVRLGAETHDGYEVLVRVPGDNPPCAYVLFRKTGGAIPAASEDLLWALLAICGALLLAVTFAAGPIVGRIRRLTANVRTSAADRYATPVPAEGADEIADLATAFNEAGSEIREALKTSEKREKALRRFVRNTTHDVMIPLTVLQGDLSDLRNRIERGEQPDRERVVQALEEAHYMGSLMHNLSAVAKLEQGEHRLQMHPVDLTALVERAAGRHKPLARMRDIELEYGVPEVVLLTRGDLTLIEQAVSNVIHNAVRYNEAGGHVAVILDAPRDKPGTFSIQVIDDGPGIAPGDMERLADRRFRGEDARTRHPDGSGLGLNITRNVAERHGMTLAFRASAYDGLEVEITGSLLAGAEGG